MAATMRIEHVATTPRGYRVRSVKRGSHVVRVAFPTGRRHKGTGKVVEILHPKSETNPSCIVSNQVRTNPGELIIFGNPQRRMLTKAEAKKKAKQAQKLNNRPFNVVRVTDHATGQKGWDITPADRNPSTDSHAWEVAKAKQRKAIADRLAGRLTEEQWRKSQQDFVTAARSAGKNPSSQAAKRATRERAARIRGARLNPELYEVVEVSAAGRPTVMTKELSRRDAKKFLLEMREVSRRGMTGAHHFMRRVRKANSSVQRYAVYKDNMLHAVKASLKEADREAIRVRESGHAAHVVGPRQFFNKKLGNPGRMQVFHDPAIKKFTAVIYDPEFGNLYASGFTKKQAAQALRDRVREYRRSGKLPAGGGYGNPKRRNAPQHVGDHNGVAMYFEGISYNAPALKLYGYSTDLALKRAIDRKLKKRRNPDQTQAAVRLFEKFHGRDPKEITEKHVSAAMRKDYTALGDLEHLKVITPLGQTVQFDFEGDGVKLASSPDGKQLYCIGGNQNLSSCLDHVSLEKDFIDLGECVQVQYLARKVHANFEPTSYYHKFGEKTGERPQLAYNKLQRQIFFVGGNYFIDTKQGVSPGIEN